MKNILTDIFPPTCLTPSGQTEPVTVRLWWVHCPRTGDSNTVSTKSTLTYTQHSALISSSEL